jgi:hypothetical protein
MPKNLGNFKQILDLARECRVKATEVIPLGVANSPSLGRGFTHTQPVQMEICDDLLFF